MEIIEPSHAVLSNFEVMQALKDIKDVTKKFGLRNLATITYEALLFLEGTHCKHQTSEKILAFLKGVEQFKFSRTECLLMINDPPTTALHIQLLVEDSEERLSEEQVKILVELVKENLINEPPVIVK